MKKIAPILWLCIVLCFIYIPILMLAVYSFTDATIVGSGINAFSFENYINLFANEELRDMILGTIALALVSATIATILGTLGAIGGFYSKKLGKSLLNSANQIPVVNADIVTGFSICVLLIVLLGVNKDTFVPLGVGHVVLCAPFVYLSVMPKPKQMHTNLYDAALDLGCNPLQAFRHVVIPEIMPGIVSGFLMSLTYSIDDFVISYFTHGSTSQTLPITIYSMTRRKVSPEVNALSAIIFVVVLAILLIMNLTDIKRSSAKKRAKGVRAE